MKVSVCIASVKNEVLTLKSVPKDVECIVVKNRPLPQAWNVAAAAATGEILVFLSDDVAFPQSYFNKMIYNVTSKPYSILSGRTLILRKDDFWKLRGFDENIYLIGGEDADLLERARQAGMTWLKDPDEVILRNIKHLHPDDDRLNRAKLWKMFLVNLNYPYFCLKHKKTTTGISLIRFFARRNLLVTLFRVFGFYYHLIKPKSKKNMREKMSNYDCEAQYGEEAARIMEKLYYMWLKDRR